MNTIRHKLTTKHKLLMMLIPAGKSMDPKMIAVWHSSLIRGFKAIWHMYISRRHITRLITELENDGVLKRMVFARLKKQESPYSQQNIYEIIDAEKGFADLFTR